MIDKSFDSTVNTVTVGGFDLRYHEAGSGPALIMLHGAGPGASAWSNFEHNLPVYAEKFRTIMIDQPGFGGTKYPAEYPSHYIVYTAKLVAELMDQLDIDTAHLLGNSLGGAVAVRFAMDFPDRADRLVLMGPGSALSVGLFAPRPSEGIRKLTSFFAAPGPSPEKMGDFLRALVYDESLITEELIEQRYQAAIDPAVRDGMSVMGEANRKPAFARDGELWREADTVTHDTLITWGREDRVQPLDGAFVGFRRMPNARLYVFPNCGHWAQVERKSEFEIVTSAFLLGEL